MTYQELIGKLERRIRVTKKRIRVLREEKIKIQQDCGLGAVELTKYIRKDKEELQRLVAALKDARESIED